MKMRDYNRFYTYPSSEKGKLYQKTQGGSMHVQYVDGRIREIEPDEIKECLDIEKLMDEQDIEYHMIRRGKGNPLELVQDKAGKQRLWNWD